MNYVLKMNKVPECGAESVAMSVSMVEKACGVGRAEETKEEN